MLAELSPAGQHNQMRVLWEPGRANLLSKRFVPRSVHKIIEKG
jgi:hypothetical protein